MFETEPLPADSPLWDEPRILISPHAAGGRPVGAGELVTANLAAFLAGGELRNVVRARSDLAAGAAGSAGTSTTTGS